MAEHHWMMKAENEKEEKDKQEMEKKLNRKWKIYYANLQPVGLHLLVGLLLKNIKLHRALHKLHKV